MCVIQISAPFIPPVLDIPRATHPCAGISKRKCTLKTTYICFFLYFEISTKRQKKKSIATINTISPRRTNAIDGFRILIVDESVLSLVGVGEGLLYMALYCTIDSLFYLSIFLLLHLP